MFPYFEKQLSIKYRFKAYCPISNLKINRLWLYIYENDFKFKVKMMFYLNKIKKRAWKPSSNMNVSRHLNINNLE
jgi:hypothetical protein